MTVRRTKEWHVDSRCKVVGVDEIPCGDAIPFVEFVESRIVVFTGCAEFGEGYVANKPAELVVPGPSPWIWVS